MGQHLIAQALQEYETAIQRHQRYVATHEAIIQVLRAYERQAITKAQAIVQLEKEVASAGELGLVGLYRQTIERLLATCP